MFKFKGMVGVYDALECDFAVLVNGVCAFEDAGWCVECSRIGGASGEVAPAAVAAKVMVPFVF